MTNAAQTESSTRSAPSFRPSPELFPFESRWLESSVGRVHYVDEGRGQPILMFHGNPTWSFLYRRVITALCDQFRCVAVDYPGFGLSDRPTGYGYTPAEHAAVVGELVRALDLRELIVLSHDWGGPIGLSVAVADPTRIAGLVLGGTWFWPPNRRFRMFSRVMSSWPLQRAILSRNLFVERFIRRYDARALTRGDRALPRGTAHSRRPHRDRRAAEADRPWQPPSSPTWPTRCHERWAASGR